MAQEQQGRIRGRYMPLLLYSVWSVIWCWVVARQHDDNDDDLSYITKVLWI